MNFKINVTKTFKVNSKKYKSAEELPADLKQAYEKALAGNQGNQPIVKSRYVVNGQEYESMEAMPPDVRQVFENAMKVARDAGNLGSGGAVSHNKTFTITGSGDMTPGTEHHSVEPERSFSVSWALLGALLLGAILIYILFLRS